MKKKCKRCYEPILHVHPYCSKCKNEDIEHIGDYRLGLTSEEIEYYIGLRANTLSTKRLLDKFDKIAGVNTCAVGPQGQSLMYRHDVKRFADKLLLGTPTYWD
jgi:hypothetical protein